MIKYSDLSAPLKVAIIIAYILGSLNLLAFVLGFILGAGQ